MNIKELRDKRLDVWNKAKAFLDDHRKDGVLSAEDDAVYARMEKELDDLAKEITRQEKLEAYEKEMAKNITKMCIRDRAMPSITTLSKIAHGLGKKLQIKFV